MAEASEKHSSSAQHQPATPIRWRSWPARQSASRTLLVVLGLLLAAVTIRVLSGQTVLTLLAMAALVAALWRFFLPVVFELSDKGVDQWVLGRHRHIPWRAVRRYEICSAGLLLLPHEDRSALAPFRGLYLPWAAHREEVLTRVRHYLDRADKA